MPFFSIVTPVCNGVGYFSSYTKSLTSQTFRDFEVIIVDDCSTDNSFEVFSSFSDFDQRFKVFSSTSIPRISSHRGPYHPRNVGLGMAKGTYICFLDVDDYWFPQHLSKYFERIRHSSQPLFLCSSYYKSIDGLPMAYKKLRLDFLPLKLQLRFCNPVPMLTACIHRSLLLQHQFQPFPHEDFVFWHSVLLTVPSQHLLQLKNYTAIYRSSKSSLSGDKFRVISWWLFCFRYFGYPDLISLLLILFKITSEFFELIYSRLFFKFIGIRLPESF